ncbi:hypothetical protein J5TS2_18160 [Brevibacillus halotolerans]|nr:hypothetical protein J5TS2_18160 [Brevibacillus halotolerans]
MGLSSVHIGLSSFFYWFSTEFPRLFDRMKITKTKTNTKTNTKTEIGD